MPKDLREMIQNESMTTEGLSKNHRKNFEELLQKELHTTKDSGRHFLESQPVL